MNTKIMYFYRDADNYKNHVTVVVNGIMTADDEQRILDSLEGGCTFIPAQVGLPDAHFVQYEPDEADHPWHELLFSEFMPSAEEATVDMTVRDLVTAFENAAGRWDESSADAWTFAPDGILCSVEIDTGEETIINSYRSLYHVGTCENMTDALLACSDIPGTIRNLTECPEKDIWEAPEVTSNDDAQPVLYLVVARLDDDTSVSLQPASWVLGYLDMMDCFSYDEIHVYDVSRCGTVEELTLHGTWHDMKRPLYIKATGTDGRIVFDGYGTDH